MANTDQLKQAIIAAGVKRNIIEEGAPVTDETLLNIVACLGMGPKHVAANTTEQALKIALEALEPMRNPRDDTAIQRAIVAVKAALAQPSQEPVAYLITKTATLSKCHPAKDVCEETIKNWKEYGFIVSPLYTHPQPSAPVAQADLNEIEQYRLQMAGISTAALGYWKESDSIHPDYDTPALRDVARLYAKYAELHKAQAERHVLTDEKEMPVELKEAIRDYRHCNTRELSAHMDMIERIYLSTAPASSKKGEQPK